MVQAFSKRREVDIQRRVGGKVRGGQSLAPLPFNSY
jgi:hypothetical protein